MNGIYIPIWLDLLSNGKYTLTLGGNDLHSNMVRFIINSGIGNTYIGDNLHSNMVRFII